MAIFVNIDLVPSMKSALERALPVISMVVAAMFVAVSFAGATDLPSIGSSAVGTVSTREEYRLGQAWLRLFRRQSPVITEPTINHYAEQLLAKLASHSALRQQQLSLVVVDNPSINAFAVPGGVIGIHTGLFTFAETEQQFASVLSHELAHLSQRHYARMVQQQRSQSIPTMAALLASLVILATTNGDAGMAALGATQAAALDSQLRFSRVFEEEADHIGMELLIRAGMDPRAVEEMFENMLRASRYSRRPPEFLLTHPITERRIADSRNRSLEYPVRHYAQSIDYQLVRAHSLFRQETIPPQAIKHFQSELAGSSTSKEGSRYGLVLALMADKQYAAAAEHLALLLAKYPHNAILLIAQSRIAAATNQLPQALSIIDAALQKSPNHYPLTVHYAELLIAANNVDQASQLLQKLSLERHFDPYIWYLLAETQGLARNIVGVHKARAEYFLLIGEFKRATKQLNNALRLVLENSQQSLDIGQRLAEIDKIERESKLQ